MLLKRGNVKKRAQDRFWRGGNNGTVWSGKASFKTGGKNTQKLGLVDGAIEIGELEVSIGGWKRKQLHEKMFAVEPKFHDRTACAKN